MSEARDNDLQCGNCKLWVGESAEPMVKIDVVDSGFEATVPPPRDLRLCKRCGKVTVFVPSKDIDAWRASIIGC